MLNDLQYMQDMKDAALSSYIKGKINAQSFVNLVVSIPLPNPFPVDWVREILKHRRFVEQESNGGD